LSERAFNALQDGYRRSLDWALAERSTVMLILAVTVALKRISLHPRAEGFLPQQDTG